MEATLLIGILIFITKLIGRSGYIRKLLGKVACLLLWPFFCAVSIIFRVLIKFFNRREL